MLLGEASEMGLAPGEWPDYIAALDEQQEGLSIPENSDRFRAAGGCAGRGMGGSLSKSSMTRRIT